MEKDILDKEYIEYYDKRIAEELEDIAISADNGKVEFTRVDHSRRAQRFGRISDGNTTEYANIALQYFSNRCALSGEKFETFELEDSSKKTNLSAEHVVALAIGGHDIAPNIVPSVLQYNVRKNGYYILDYWSKQKDNNGKPIYSPYRLLKVVNYMLKSIEARKSPNAGDIEGYRQAILTPNAIDNLLSQIEAQDLQETDNSKRKILSSTITTTTLDEDNKKILTTVPSIDRDIPDQHEQAERENDYREMIESFISDSIGVIGREIPQVQITRRDGTQASLGQELQSMYERVLDTIPLEVEIRKTIIDTLEQQGIENIYTITNSYIYNTDILEKVRELPSEERKQYVTQEITTRIQELSTLLTNEEMTTLVSSEPYVIYDEGIIDRITLWQKLNIQAPDVHPSNIDFALRIMQEYDFEGTLNHTLTLEEEKAIVQCLVGNSKLNKGKNPSYISRLKDKLIDAGLTVQDAYGAIINYAIGNGNYSNALGGITKYNAETITETKTDITIEAIDMAVEKQQKRVLQSIDIDEEKSKKKLEELGIEALDVHPRNIDFALRIMREYDFEGALNHTLTLEEEKAIVQCLIGNNKLNGVKALSYISTLQSKLIGAGLTEQEAYGAIINYAIGNGSYSRALGGTTKYNAETITETKTDITAEDVCKAITKQQKRVLQSVNTDEDVCKAITKQQKRVLQSVNIDEEKSQKKLEELGIEASEVHPRNIDFALRMMQEYEFETALGHPLTLEEEKAIVQCLIGIGALNKGRRTKYISILQSELMVAGLTEQEAYGAIINYAIGNGNYSKALHGTTKYNSETIAEIKMDITAEDVCKAITKQQKRVLQSVNIDEEKSQKKLEELGIEASEVHPRNIDFALRMMQEYEFETALGHPLTLEEEKAIVQCLIGIGALNKGRRTKYISILQSELMVAGLTEQEAYGAIINYAIGTGNGSYCNALNGTTKYNAETIGEIKTNINEETVAKAVAKQQKEALQGIEIDEQEYKNKLEELGIEIGKKHPRNIDFALRIVLEYDFEEKLKRTLTLEEEKTIVQSLLRPSTIDKGRGTKYISILQSKLMVAGLTEQEAYGAIINYAIGTGNGSYCNALNGTTKYNAETIGEIKTNINEETVAKAVAKQQKETLQGIEIDEEKSKKKLEELGIEASEVHPRNIDFALRIIREYDFEGILNHTLTSEEEKAIMQCLIGNGLLNTTRYNISTLQSKLIGAGLAEQEVYGAIINYAIGNGNYTSALNGTTKYNAETIAEIKTDITAEDICKAITKQQKKTARLAKRTVSKETITQINDTLAAIDEIIAERKGQQIETV